MKVVRHGIPFALSVLAAGAMQVAWATPPSPPTAGAYVTDAQNTWVQDSAGDRIGTVNMIMCIIGSMRGDAMVNQGAYVALIDKNRCEGRGDSSKSTSSSAGASNASDFMSSVVQASQASESDPLIIKAWLSNEEDNGGSPTKSTIYAYVVAHAGKSATYPNGLFEMYFCGLPQGQSTCMFRGSLKSQADGLSFYEHGDNGNGGSYDTQLKLQSNPNTDSGLGQIATDESGSPESFSFAFDAHQFHRDDHLGHANSDVCFARDASLAEHSTWRYGTYNADGSRLDVAHPGFPVKYVYNGVTSYGFWSFWGLSLPESAMSHLSQGQGTLTRQTANGDQALTIETHGGKLWKLTRHNSSLSSLKNVSMMVSVPQNMGGLQAGHNYEVKWDGSALQAVSENICDNNGCSPQPLNAPVAIAAGDLRTSFVKSLPIYFPSGGGNGTITVPDTGAFIGDSTVYYRSRDMVQPSDPTLHLDCVSQCLKSGSNLSAGLAANPQSPYTGTWNPTLTLASYTFTAGSLTDDNNSNTAVDASLIAKENLGGYQWGLNSGSMIEHSAIDSVRCDLNATPNTSGAYYCAGLVDQADVIYQWETGPNQWNQYVGAAGVTIDPPKMLNLYAQSSTIAGAAAPSYYGNTVQLQYSGFGELQGIPGGCVDPDTNQAVQCTQSTRWVPAFDIVDGTAVTDNTGAFFVKYLERESRLGKVTCDGTSPSLGGASALTLPSASLITVDPRAQLGDTIPTPANPKPSVIDGTVQSGS